MLSSVFAKTLRDMRFQILGWGLGLSAMCAGVVWVFPSFQNMPDVEGFIKMLPPAFQKIIGGQTSLNVLEEFLRLKLYDSWLPISLSVFAIVHGASAIAGEEERGTMDLLMANPVRRWRVVLEKFAAIALGIITMCALCAATLVLSIQAAGIEASLSRVAWATLNVAPVSILFGAVALAGSCTVRHVRHATAVAVVLMAGSYFVYVLAPLAEVLKTAAKFSVFYYYSRTQPFAGTGETVWVWALVALTALFVALAVGACQRKDLSV